MYFRSFKLAVFASVVCLGINSCGSNDDPESPVVEHTLDATLSSTGPWGFAGDEHKLEVKTDAPGTWSVKCSESWLTTDPQRGKGNLTIKIAAAKNDATTERSATVTITLATEDGGAKKELTVTQGGKQLDWEIKITDKPFVEVAKGCPVFQDWGEMSMCLYQKFVCEEDGLLRLQHGDCRLHIFLFDKEPGYKEFVNWEAREYTVEWVVAPDLPQSRWTTSSASMVSIEGGGGAGDGECYDACPMSSDKDVKIRVKKGTYWIVCTVSGYNPCNSETGMDEDYTKDDRGQYTPSELRVNATYTFTADKK